MRNKIISLALTLLLIPSVGFSQATDFKVSSISDDLKKDAYAVVRLSEKTFEYKSEKTASERISFAITILDKKAIEMGDFYYPGDKDRKLKKFSGTLYDAEGKLLRKFKMSDVISSEYSVGFSTDDKNYFFDCETPVIPFTIHYEYEIAHSNGFLVFPSFYPQYTYNLAVENACYKLILPESVKTLSYYRGVKLDPPQKTALKTGVQQEWSVKNLKAIEKEPYQPELENYIPILYIRPENFVYDSTPGSFSDWNSMGKWIYGLVKDRDALPDEAKAKIIELTKDCTNERDKVKALYDHLGKTTRYVSIQLGIGGYQPMTAEEVYKTGFGDCKALSNYMKAMLKVVGIESNYAPVVLDEHVYKTLFPDYPNFNQMNHAILQVPFKNDTIWLECTNPRIPFGFIHNGIAGQEALEISEKGGVIRRLPDYADSLNVEKNSARVELQPDGSAKVIMRNEFHTKIYDENSFFLNIPAAKQIDFIRKTVKLPTVAMSPLKITENKSELPSIIVDSSWETKSYGNKSGSRIFIPVNPLRSLFFNLSKNKRVQDIEINFGYQDIDSITIKIPENYEIESIPQSFSEEFTFGKFVFDISQKDGEIFIKNSLLINKGYYKVTEYQKFAVFIEKINNYYSSRIALKMKQ